MKVGIESSLIDDTMGDKKSRTSHKAENKKISWQY